MKNLKNWIIIVLILLVVFISIFLLTKNDGEENIINKLEDLQGKKIGTLLGSPLSEEKTREIIPEVEVSFYNDAMDSIAALQSNQIDGAIVSYPTAFLVTKNIPELKILTNLTEDEAGIAVRKDDIELYNKVNEYVAELKSNGTMNEMLSRWYNEENPNYTMPEISIPEEGEKLVVGVAADREPSCFLNSEGKVVGLDGEIALRIANHLNRPIEFVEMKFASLITALESGKVDIVVSNLIITEERKQSANMTDGYFDSPLVLIVRK